MKQFPLPIAELGKVLKKYGRIVQPLYSTPHDDIAIKVCTVEQFEYRALAGEAVMM